MGSPYGDCVEIGDRNGRRNNTGKPMKNQYVSEYKTKIGNFVDVGCFSNPNIVARMNTWHRGR